tara:strand:- start:135 stop:437 length:303 start_codon:yes stop_codon:yes gene_type:complete
MRTTGATNSTMKYNCSITVMDNEVLNEDYSSLKKLADAIDIPYHTITDVFEGRRSSFMKYENKKYFPSIKIRKLIDIENAVVGEAVNDVGGLDSDNAEVI